MRSSLPRDPSRFATLPRSPALGLITALLCGVAVAIAMPARAQEVGANDFRVTHQGPDGNPSWDAGDAAVAYDPDDDVYLVAYQGDTMGASDSALEGDATEIFVQFLTGAGAPIGSPAVVSTTGPPGDARFDAALPDVAYNPGAGEFLVVWQSDAEGDNAFEIYGQRLDAATGAEIGSDFKITTTGPNGDASFDAIHGRVAWSPSSNRYLIVFQAGGTVSGKRDHEIYAQRLAANGTAIGAVLAVSGPDGDPDRDGLHPAVVFDPAGNAFAVVWEGEIAENESQIFCELRHATTGERVGGDNVQVSEQGPGGVNHFDADDPTVAFAAANGRLMVAWVGDASVGPGPGGVNDDEEEIFGRLLAGATGLAATPVVRLSTTGPDGHGGFDALDPQVVWSADRRRFVVAWDGEEQADNEVEIYGQEVDDGSGAPVGADDFRISDMGPEGQPALGAALPALAYSPVRDQVLVVWQGDDAVDEEIEIYGQILGAGPQGPCQPTSTRLCLRGGLFALEVSWLTRTGNAGLGQAVKLTNDTGYFWFFQDSNVELVIKILDGRPVNDHFWVFYGALSDVQYTITVTNTATGKGKVYFNPQRTLASVADTSAFADAGEPAQSQAPPPGVGDEAPRLAERAACQPSATALCLNQSAFEVKVAWKTRQGATGVGKAVVLTGDTGWFWFFNDTNLELMVKVLDGRAINGYYWVFYGALSDVEYTITVTDTQSGAVKTYFNPQRNLASVADTSAFSP